MIGRVARAEIAVVFRLVIFVIRRQAAESDRREQLRARDFDHRRPMRRIENCVLERYRQELVRTTREVIAIRTVHDVVQEICLWGPESLVEGPLRFRSSVSDTGSDWRLPIV